MDQSDIIQETIVKFSDKFKPLANIKILDPVEKQVRDDNPVTTLGIEEVVLGNMNEKIQIKEKDANGNLVESLAAPASLFNISVMVTPYYKTYADTLKIIGAIARLMKDDNKIEVDRFDWIDNNKKPIIIYPISGMTLEKQMQIFSMLKSDYRPSLFYQFAIGIDSAKKEIFRRVEERKFTTYDKLHKK
jgi:hypothetical protein